MARQRIILPEYWLDAELAQCDYVVRLFYIGSWTFSDDYGVIEDDLPKLRAQIFPYDLSIDLLPIRDRLVALKKFLPFEAEGKKWLYIKNFLKFQKVEKPSKWQNPKPPKEIVGEQSGSPTLLVGEEYRRREEKRSEVNRVYSYYKDKINQLSRLTPNAEKKIESRLSGFSEAELRRAIENFSGEKWWMENNAGRGVAWFFNSDDRIDQFLNLKNKSNEVEKVWNQNK